MDEGSESEHPECGESERGTVLFPLKPSEGICARLWNGWYDGGGDARGGEGENGPGAVLHGCAIQEGGSVCEGVEKHHLHGGELDVGGVLGVELQCDVVAVGEIESPEDRSIACGSCPGLCELGFRRA